MLLQGAFLTQAGQGGHGRVLGENLSSGIWSAGAPIPALYPPSCVAWGRA